MCAVSGGADSVGLLVILAELAKKTNLMPDISAMHLNHNLRGKFSDADEDFVRKLASDLDINLVCKSLNVEGFADARKISLETAGRILRRKELTANALSHNAGKIATGHHKDDNAETVVHRMMRGTGFAGLAGIRAAKQFEQDNADAVFIRPLLCLRKEEIERYLQEKKLQWRTDHTNAQTKYTRNKIRHKIIPELQEESTADLVEKIANISNKSGKFCDLLEIKADNFIDNNVLEKTTTSLAVNLPSFSNLSKAEFVEVVNKLLALLGEGLKKMTSIHYDRLYEMVQNNKESSVNLPGSIVAMINRGRIVFIKPQNPGFEQCQRKIDVEGTTKFGHFDIKTSFYKAGNVDLEAFIRNKDQYIEWFDADEISFPVFARTRREGDRFVPIGRKSSRKVSKFITSSSVLREKRHYLFLIEDSSGRILWLVPLRRAGSLQLSSKSRNILEIKVSGVKI